MAMVVLLAVLTAGALLVLFARQITTAVSSLSLVTLGLVLADGFFGTLCLLRWSRVWRFPGSCFSFLVPYCIDRVDLALVRMEMTRFTLLEDLGRIVRQ